MQRPYVHGKFLYVAGEHFWIRGVTYGTFKPDAAGLQFPPKSVVERDFRAISDAGLNAVRVYIAPPLWLMNAAAAFGLRVMVGQPWEQHISFLDDKRCVRRIIDETRATARSFASHPAVLCYLVGNEIPASIVRWYGKRRIERFIATLCTVIKSEDHNSLVTYANFPTTEYLELPFADFLSFNVYLERRENLRSYLARLQHLAGERPLVMTELGLDSRQNGEDGQAETLAWQIATAFGSGCAGTVIFAWTDEWYRGGEDITDWDFGLTTRDRRPKNALQAVSASFANLPVPVDCGSPKVSVVICSYNGERTIDETLTAVEQLKYPNYEIIVIDDGSNDQTSAIAREHDVRLIRTSNNGLAYARNVGMNAASGEIVAYIDDDAYPDPHWLSYLVASLLETEHAGIGGPNIAPPGDGAIADCIANAPGNPVHVLLSDDVAEHIPGCNMAFRRDRLVAIGGFDPRFRVAGDDVDVCWRLQLQGWTLGFAPAALVWHHRRNSIRTYLGQQRGYAKAEALLAEKWPEKYNSVGHLIWQGRLYGRGVVEILFQRSRIYHGVWGAAPFQSLYEPSGGPWTSLLLMPEWYCVLLCLGFLTVLGVSWSALFWVAPALLAGILVTLGQAIWGAKKARFHPEPRSKVHRLELQVIIIFLHLAQPAARLWGRIRHGLGPWSWKGFTRVIPVRTTDSLWTERWQPMSSRLSELKAILEGFGAVPIIATEFDQWDLAISGGLFGSIRVLAMEEDHGGGRQLCRFRSWPELPRLAAAAWLVLVILTAWASLDNAPLAAISLGIAAAGITLLVYVDCAIAKTHWQNAVAEYVRRSSTTVKLGHAEQ